LHLRISHGSAASEKTFNTNSFNTQSARIDVAMPVGSFPSLRFTREPQLESFNVNTYAQSFPTPRLIYILALRMVDDCFFQGHFQDSARPFMVWWQAWLCVWIRYGIVAPFIVVNARHGAIFHVTFPVVARTSFGIWGSLWCIFNRGVMAWWVTSKHSSMIGD
jgi:hypothetical protein